MMRLAGMRSTGALVAGSLAAACLWMGNAQAAFVPTATGSQLLPSDSYLSEPGSTASSPLYTTTQPGSDYLLAVPGQYNFQNFFSSQPLTQAIGTDAVGNYAFQDSFVFQVGAGAIGDSLVATLNLDTSNGNSFGMSDLQARLYQITSGTTTPVVGPVANGQGPVVNVLSLWKGQSGLDNAPVQIDFSGLTTAGTYVLDVAGTATGSVGGQYFGGLALQPVPLPATTWLLLSGIMGLVLAARRGGATH
jgi:hypothetical protein